MIHKITSKDFNEILNNANNKINKIDTETKIIKKELLKKLKIIEYEMDYATTKLAKINNTMDYSSKTDEESQYHVFEGLYNNELSHNTFDYGITSSAMYKNVPINLFNIIATKTGEAFFRDKIMEVKINGIKKEEYKNILKHDNVTNKEIFFEEMVNENDEIEISITSDTIENFYNSFNSIELDMFLNGAYDIEHIRIYTSDNTYDEYCDYKDAGKMVISLDKNYVFNRIDIKFKLKYFIEKDNKKIYPFGIKHIYFNNVEYVKDTYAIIPIKVNKYIDAINNDLTIKTPNESIQTTALDENIKFYLDVKFDPITHKPILISEQKISKDDDINAIAMNVKTIYAKIPLDKAIIGIVFNLDIKIF